MMPTASLPNLALWITAFLLLAMAVAGPVAQPAHYHAFAEQRVLCGIPHAANVLSNAGFLIVGLYGYARRPPGPAYAIFFIALVATAFGSAWHHLAPAIHWPACRPIAEGRAFWLAMGRTGETEKIVR